MRSPEIKRIIGNAKHLKGTDGTWWSYYQDCANFALPNQAWVNTIKVSGQELNLNFLYDTRAVLAVKKSAAGFHSNLTNPSTRWYQSETIEERYMQTGRVQRYFRECDDIQYDIMNASNFNRAMMEFYKKILVFGMATTLTEESEKKKVRYTSVPIDQAVFEEDADGYICATYRFFKLSAIQCQMKWRDAISPDMKKALKDGDDYKMFDILHYVSTRDRRDVSKADNVNMEYCSEWIVIDEEHELGEGGFLEDPYSTARWWKDTMDGSSRAYSPVMDALASIKLVNAQKRTLIRVSMKQADPAIASPYKFWIAPMNANPAAMNYYDASKFRLDQFQAIKNEGNIPVTVDVMKLEQDLIDAHLYVNLFENLMNVTKQMTVPEVQKRAAEALALISPVIGHVLDEGHTPILLRTRSILERRREFPIPPKEIQGKDLKVTYLSPLAKAQRSAEMNGLNAWTEYVKGLVEVWADAKYIVNIDRVGRSSAELFGVNPENVADQKDIDSRKKQDQQLNQKMMQLKMAGEAAKVAHTGAEAQKTAAETANVK